MNSCKYSKMDVVVGLVFSLIFSLSWFSVLFLWIANHVLLFCFELSPTALHTVAQYSFGLLVSFFLLLSLLPSQHVKYIYRRRRCMMMVVACVVTQRTRGAGTAPCPDCWGKRRRRERRRRRLEDGPGTRRPAASGPAADDCEDAGELREDRWGPDLPSSYCDAQVEEE